MSWVQWLFVSAAVLLTAITVGWMVFTRRLPENAASNREIGFRSGGGPTHPPADAAAESQRVDARRTTAPWRPPTPGR